MTLTPEQCRAARLARDARFDGRFFTGVLSTGIYCRPVCPARPPLEANVRYFFSAAAAEQTGLRPCLRCRPELAPGERHALPTGLARAINAIERGDLADLTLDELAARCAMTARTLRRQCEQYLGLSPHKLEQTRRLLLAKQLLTDTSLSVTDVAFSAGFHSLRRFNDAWLNAYGLCPSALRKRVDPIACGEGLVLHLGYRPPYDFAALLSFFRVRAIKDIEEVSAHGYVRHLAPGDDGMPARIEVCQGDGHHLRVTFYGVAPKALPALLHKVRRQWDLDADPLPIVARLQEGGLAPWIAAAPGLRLPGGWSPLEVMLRAIIGQQISVKGAITLLGRLVARRAELFGAPRLPDAAELKAMSLDGLGLTGSRVRTLKGLAEALLGGLNLETAQDAELLALPGIGPWTVAYWRLRCGQDPDAFPASDLVLQKSPIPGRRLSVAELTALAEPWRPWRAYAASWLWHGATHRLPFSVMDARQGAPDDPL
ncbi:AraC family transcriptional regulator [Aeromonas schubertii]|uniref:Ada metal-binding domain-containing protein n=1 Tax=Aeromonas schubertii TaxID=652 RepID=UPI00067F62E8|nr:Ada metal-binding domain-containing protein [Aeromonas schubertii]KUE80252.1 AraC family transcriptional regulator [Aeromonas schubertii]